MTQRSLCFPYLACFYFSQLPHPPQPQFPLHPLQVFPDFLSRYRQHTAAPTRTATKSPANKVPISIFLSVFFMLSASGAPTADGTASTKILPSARLPQQ